MAKPRVKVPKTATAGEVVTIKSLIDHKMDSGQAKDKAGNLIPRKIINAFSATFNGVEVMNVRLEPAISTNPYFQFSFKVPETGDLVFKWVDDDGTVTEKTNRAMQFTPAPTRYSIYPVPIETITHNI